MDSQCICRYAPDSGKLVPLPWFATWKGHQLTNSGCSITFYWLITLITIQLVYQDVVVDKSRKPVFQENSLLSLALTTLYAYINDQIQFKISVLRSQLPQIQKLVIFQVHFKFFLLFLLHRWQSLFPKNVIMVFFYIYSFIFNLVFP